MTAQRSFRDAVFDSVTYTAAYFAFFLIVLLFLFHLVKDAIRSERR